MQEFTSEKYRIVVVSIKDDGLPLDFHPADLLSLLGEHHPSSGRLAGIVNTAEGAWLVYECGE